MEGYVDDMLIKLNPFKYVFSIKSGKFLGFLVSNKGIKPNPEKVQAILNMTHPWSIKKFH